MTSDLPGTAAVQPGSKSQSRKSQAACGTLPRLWALLGKTQLHQQKTVAVIWCRHLNGSKTAVTGGGEGGGGESVTLFQSRVVSAWDSAVCL